MRIIGFRKKSDIDVEFQDKNKHIVHNTTYTNFIKGQISNPYDITVYGVGYIGIGNYLTKINRRTTDDYHKWCDMLRRCYFENAKERFPAYYKICSVCEEWLCFQNFAKWYDENKYDVKGRLHLDKDILVPGNKIYSPKTCMLVPQRINMLFMTHRPNKYGLPEGISIYNINKYSASYQGKALGIFDTLIEACTIYIAKKEEVLKQVADEYKDMVPPHVYEALYQYKINIDDYIGLAKCA